MYFIIVPINSWEWYIMLVLLIVTNFPSQAKILHFFRLFLKHRLRKCWKSLCRTIGDGNSYNNNINIRNRNQVKTGSNRSELFLDYAKYVKNIDIYTYKTYNKFVDPSMKPQKQEIATNYQIYKTEKILREQQKQQHVFDKIKQSMKNKHNNIKNRHKKSNVMEQLIKDEITMSLSFNREFNNNKKFHKKNRRKKGKMKDKNKNKNKRKSKNNREKHHDKNRRSNSKWKNNKTTNNSKSESVNVSTGKVKQHNRSHK